MCKCSPSHQGLMECRGKSAEKWKLSDRWEISLPTSEMLRELIQYDPEQAESWRRADGHRLNCPANIPLLGCSARSPSPRVLEGCRAKGQDPRAPRWCSPSPAPPTAPLSSGFGAIAWRQWEALTSSREASGKRRTFHPNWSVRNASAVMSKAPQKMSLRND